MPPFCHAASSGSANPISLELSLQTRMSNPHAAVLWPPTSAGCPGAPLPVRQSLSLAVWTVAGQMRRLILAGQVARYLSEGTLSRPAGILRLSTLRVDFGLARASFVQARAKIGPGSGQGGTLNAPRAATLNAPRAATWNFECFQGRDLAPSSNSRARVAGGPASRSHCRSDSDHAEAQRLPC